MTWLECFLSENHVHQHASCHSHLCSIQFEYQIQILDQTCVKLCDKSWSSIIQDVHIRSCNRLYSPFTAATHHENVIHNCSTMNLPEHDANSPKSMESESEDYTPFFGGFGYSILNHGMVPTLFFSPSQMLESSIDLYQMQMWISMFS